MEAPRLSCLVKPLEASLSSRGLLPSLMRRAMYVFMAGSKCILIRVILRIPRLSRRSPPRFSPCLTVGPEAAGISATHAKEAKAASERNRPESDRLKDLRCGVRPDAEQVQEPDGQLRMSWRSWFSNSAASAWRCPIRWAVERSADSHAVLAGRRGAITEAGTARDLLRSATATLFGTEVIPARIAAQRLAFPAAQGLDDVLGGPGPHSPRGWLEHVRLAASMDRRALGAANLDAAFTSVLKKAARTAL
ncbi:hypothetical protein GCM10027074_09560 [Streptomyces deserti]